MDADQTPSRDNPGWFQDFREGNKDTILKDAVPCDNKHCSDEATHYTTTKCCNTPKICCRDHFMSYFAHLDKMEKSGYTFTCNTCGTTNYPTKVFNEVSNLRLN